MTGDLDMDAGSTLIVEIDGADAGNFDQVQVTGSVMLAGDLELDETFTPAVGQSFVIIDNDGNDAVIGTFAGLAEGDIVTSNFNGAGLAANITYMGGDGNDVAITILPPITAENDTAMVNEDDGPVMIDVLDNDSITVGVGPTIMAPTPTMSAEGGTVELVGDDFSYNPPAGSNGEDSFSYTITNGTVTDTATVTVTVNPINDGPVITAPATLNTDEDTPFTLSGFTITDVDSSDLTVTLSVDDGSLSETTFSGTPAEVTATINSIIYKRHS